MRELTRSEQIRLMRNSTISAALVGGIVCGAVGFLVGAVAAMANSAEIRR